MIHDQQGIQLINQEIYELKCERMFQLDSLLESVWQKVHHVNVS